MVRIKEKRWLLSRLCYLAVIILFKLGLRKKGQHLLNWYKGKHGEYKEYYAVRTKGG